uniref:Hexose transporter 1 n=1 Tax=Pseudictyota dubia TaxID=2749911 RepID=A0A7R9WFZ3_9STRA|mmetsp:Transcript_49424/g.91526  ORF Transcript_49424/g.91526 Transcript_49424/m.91526 type:complete len:453 (+) Transcript_49424:573-1931(+)
MNNSEAFIMQYFHDQGKEYSLMGWSTTVSMYGVGGLLGSVIGPKVIGRWCGRRATLLWNNVFLIISSYLIAFGPEWWWQAVGRVFVGIVAGVATAVVPTYFSEISPIEVRGAVGTMHQLGITIGILVSQALSTPSLNLFGSEEDWKWLFLVPVLCGLLEIIVLPFCPESPSYLFQTHGEASARQALVRLQSEDKAEEYLGYIQEELSAANNGGESMTIAELFQDRLLRKQLVVGITVQLMMQFSGIDAVFYYSTTVFYQADVSDPELATTCLGIINVIVTIFAVKFMDTAGRKTLLKYSWIGMLISYLVLTTSFVLKGHVALMDQVSIVAAKIKQAEATLILRRNINLSPFNKIAKRFLQRFQLQQLLVLSSFLHLALAALHGSSLQRSSLCMLVIQPWQSASSSTGSPTGWLPSPFLICSSTPSPSHFWFLSVPPHFSFTLRYVSYQKRKD